MKKAVFTMVEQIEREGLIDIDDKGIALVADDAVAKLLPENLTQEQLDLAVDTQSNIGSALAIAFGKQSKAVFDKNKDLQVATMETNISKATKLNVATKREENFTVAFGEKKGEKVSKPGYTTMSYSTKAPVSAKVVRKTIQQHWTGLSD